MERICLTCNKKFNALPSRIKIGKGKFCSLKCMGIAKKNGIEQICQICGKKNYVKLSRIKKGGGKFCSRKCASVWQSKYKKGKNSSSWRGGEIKRICLICHKEFHIRSCVIKKGGGKFCSTKCFGIWVSMNKRGKNSYLWKGGITPIIKQIRNSNKYKQWRQDIFIRDDFTCQKCGQVGGELEAHHIKSFSKLIQEVKKYLPLLSLYEGAMIYTPLWNLKNGITLCKKCHRRIKR